MWVVRLMCMEATLGISLYSYIYLKLVKTLCLFYYPFCFLYKKFREKRGTGSTRKPGQGAGVACGQTMYTHVNKCKRDKIKTKKVQKIF
jgi:hypothetical protein